MATIEDNRMTIAQEDCVMKMPSFKDYVRNSGLMNKLEDAEEAEKPLLLEDVVAKIRQLWPKSNLFQMLEITKFSPDYNPQTQFGKLFIKLGDTQEEADRGEGTLTKSIKDQFDGNKEQLKKFLSSAKVKIEKFTRVQQKSKTEKTEQFGILLSGPLDKLAELYALLVGSISFADVRDHQKSIAAVNGGSTRYTDLAHFGLEDGFLQSLTVDGDVSRSTRWLLNTAYKALSKDGKTFEGVLAELKSARVALLLKWFNGDLKKQLKGVNLDTIPSVAELKKIVDEASEKTSSPEVLPQEKLENGSMHPAAARRLDLFDAAKKFGAMTYTDGKWIAAVTTTFKQNCVFGRAKPKVIPETQEIDQTVYRYDEDGMSQDQKNRRDGKTAEYVKDGIGFDDQWTETGWCTAGSYQCADGHWNYNFKSNHHWRSYTDSGRYPLIVCMNLSTGRLYQYLNKEGKVDFLNEADTTDDGERSGSAFIDRLMKEESGKTLGKMIVQGEQVHYAQEFKKLIENADVTDDGFLDITSQSQLKKFKKIFGKFAGIKLHSSSVAQWFLHGHFEHLPVIDMSSVENANSMFAGAVLTEVKLKNCHASNMSNMFGGAKVNKVEGLDTSHAVDITDMFNGTRVNKRDDQSYTAVKLQPFTLDLKSCRSMDRAFYNSHVDQVLIENTDKVTTAQGAFAKCQFLKTLPDMRFKSLQGLGIGRSLVLDGVGLNNPDGSQIDSHSAEEIFAYSPRVVSNPDYDRAMKEIEEFYTKPTTDSEIVDERGYLIIRNQQTAKALAKSFKSYPGIKIEMEDASGLFYATHQTLFIKALDLTGVKNASDMFRATTILHLGKVEGTEDLFDMRNMFKDANISQLPDMVCPKGERFDSMFAVKCDAGGIVPLLPTKLVIGKASFMTTNDWSHANDDIWYAPVKMRSFAEALFGDATEYFQKSFPWELRKILETASEAQFERLQLKVDDSGAITVRSEEAARLLSLNLSALTKCKILKLEPVDGKARGWFAGLEADHLVFPTIDLTKVKDATAMFFGTTVKRFSGFINADHLEVASRMFTNAEALTGGIDILDGCRSLKTANYMFENCIVSDAPEKCILPQLEDGCRMFRCCSMCYPRVLSKQTVSFPKLKRAENMFSSSIVLRIDELELPECINCQQMFEYSTALTKVGTISIPLAVKASNIFYRCGQLETVGSLLAPQATEFDLGFSSCSKLKMIGHLDIRSATNISQTFYACSNLKCIMMPKWCSQITQSSGTFKKCSLDKKYGVDAKKLILFLRSRVGQAMARARR